MKCYSIVRTGAALLAAVLLLPMGALAQTAGGGSPAVSAAAPPPATDQKARLQRVDGRIADLHAKLHITAAEEPQWREFAEVMRDNARKMDQKFAARAAGFSTMNAVQDMQSYAEITQQHAENMQRLVPAFQKLYDALSPQQKQTADAVWRSYPGRGAARRGG